MLGIGVSPNPQVGSYIEINWFNICAQKNKDESEKVDQSSKKWLTWLSYIWFLSFRIIFCEDLCVEYLKL